ncbi:HlyD family secretion protein [Mucilaginibacter endophyticus]|uniref:HlyD family secretion protein n=1 Tax=Mucilaginibacter endophyticus TaxID=2675003 RepID=UPI00137ADE6B|nr:HlyD family secretion protein [Mucilaginibacter endophyticus]
MPPWLLRSGINALLVCSLLFTMLALLIHYPETVTTRITISSTAQAKTVSVQEHARLVKILVSDRAIVERGTTLAYLESSADHVHLLRLLPLLLKLKKQLSAGLKPDCDSVLLLGGDQLGDVQDAFARFHEKYLAYADSSRQTYYRQKRTALTRDQQYLVQQYQKLQSQQALSQRNVSLAGDDYAMHERLEAQHVETKAEMRAQESSYLAKKMPLIQNENAMISNKIAVSAVRKELFELDNLIAVNKAGFEQAVTALITAIEDWKFKYTLTAPVSGMLMYTGNIQENDEIAAGREVFHINPVRGQLFGIMIVPPDKLGRIRVGQQVIVKIDGYPFEEFGRVDGHISRINDLSAEGLPCSAFVSLRENTTLPGWVREALKGDAEVITGESTLFQRLTRSVTRGMGPSGL